MKTKKLLAKLTNLFQLNDSARSAEMKSIKVLMKKLKKKERSLKKKLTDAQGKAEKEEKKVIQDKLAIIYAQRKKGINILKKQS